MKTKLLLLILILNISFASSQELKRFNIISSLKTIKEFNLSNIGHSIKYVQLETTDNVLISNISNIKIDKYIYIKSKEGLFVFSLDGKFIRKIGNKGKGPREYQSFIDFAINSQTIWLMDVIQDKIIKYDTNGDYLDYIKFDNPAKKLLSSEENIYLLNTTIASFWGEEDSGILVYNYNNDGKLISVIKNRNSEKPSACSSSYIFDSKLFFIQTLNDTVFSTKGTNLIPEYLIDLGKYTPNKAVYKKSESNKFMSCKWIAETDKSIFIKILGSEKSYYCLVYDKKKEILYTLKNNSFLNDIDDGISFWPEFVSDDKCVKTLWFHNLIELEERGVLSGELKDKYKQMDINSNPILMIISSQ